MTLHDIELRAFPEDSVEKKSNFIFSLIVDEPERILSKGLSHVDYSLVC